VLVADVYSVGENTEERLGDEREAAGVLHELECDGAQPEPAREVKIER
jgi:hypothetical protein